MRPIAAIFLQASVWHVNADLIIEKIDSGELSPSSHQVVRRLCGLINYPEKADVGLISAFDRGDLAEVKRWGTVFWARIDALPTPQQGAIRLVSGLASPDEPVDWYYAEYLIRWARDEGVSDSDICSAFGL